MANTYIVINLDDTNAILFSQVNQSSAQKMRRNLANTQGLLSYITEPSFITNGSLVPATGPMTHSECLELMDTAAWKPEEPEQMAYSISILTRIKKKRKGVHSKTKTSNIKTSKYYVKKYKGQGR